MDGGVEMTIKIAQLSCGTEYSSVQYEIEKAARSVGATIVYPDVSSETSIRLSRTLDSSPVPHSSSS